MRNLKRTVTMISSAFAMENIDWDQVAAQLDVDGYALLPDALAPEFIGELVREHEGLRRVSLVSIQLGRGDMLGWGAGLPTAWATLRASFYRELVCIANRWNETLGVGYRYPSDLDQFLVRNRKAGQRRPISHINRLRTGDYICLHQSNEGEHVFPLQLVALLSDPNRDFRGGEFVLTEQRPRMQSRPMVLPLRFGDIAVISTAHRPFQGTRGFYRVNLKHAISRVREGERVGIEISFHDSP
jgi:uncharacterized protein